MRGRADGLARLAHACMQSHALGAPFLTCATLASTVSTCEAGAEVIPRAHEDHSSPAEPARRGSAMPIDAARVNMLGALLLALPPTAEAAWNAR
jgi:hypothetical protein